MSIMPEASQGTRGYEPIARFCQNLRMSDRPPITLLRIDECSDLGRFHGINEGATLRQLPGEIRFGEGLLKSFVDLLDSC